MENNVGEQLIAYIDSSPSCYHAVENIAKMLEGYTQLKEQEEWEIKPGQSYFVVRKDSSLIAFRVPKKPYESVYIASAHSDSPSFKIKPLPCMTNDHYTRLNTEKYGGMNMASWLDRPLSIAGRLVVEGNDGLETRLVNVDRDLLIIPSLAIHMNREVNNGFQFDAQVDTIPILGDEKSGESLNGIIAQAAGVDEKDIKGEDLFLYNRCRGSIWGPNGEYVSDRALDDLQCAFAIVKGFIEAEASDDRLCLCCIFDNEEVGSLTGQGADSTFLEDTLSRINEALGHNNSYLLKAVAGGYMISADNAHAVHPNHPEVADPTNCPYMNGGIVIKYNAAQKYTTDAISEAMVKTVCEKAGVPTQSYANESNIAGGSTLGNIANRHVSIPTVDIGLAQLAMHSAYETAGVRDTQYLIDAIKIFFGEA